MKSDGLFTLDVIVTQYSGLQRKTVPTHTGMCVNVCVSLSSRTVDFS